jgi:hypothetical protein
MIAITVIINGVPIDASVMTVYSGGSLVERLE